MPIYAFACDSCGHQFDRLQKLSDPDPTVCPSCAAEAVRRQLTAPSFRLAGAGWYETDFKKDGDTKRNLADKGEGGAGSSESSSEGKTETKTETKVESKVESKAESKSDAKPAASVEAKPAAKPEASKPANQTPST